MQYPITGLSIADSRHPIETHAQLGGLGVVYNKALAIPVHLGYPWHSLEWVSIPAGGNGVGQHTQDTDEISLIVEGRGELMTNGQARPVSEGWLVIAPKGTTHQISNTSREQPLSFLVAELLVPEGASLHPPALLDLYSRRSRFCPFTPVGFGHQPIVPVVANVDLADYFAASWGTLWLVWLPPGSRMVEWVEPECDQVIFSLRGVPTIQVRLSQHRRDELRIDGDQRYHQSVVVPAGLPRRVTNRARGGDPLLVAFLNVRRTRTREALGGDQSHQTQPCEEQGRLSSADGPGPAHEREDASPS